MNSDLQKQISELEALDAKRSQTKGIDNLNAVSEFQASADKMMSVIRQLLAQHGWRPISEAPLHVDILMCSISPKYNPRYGIGSYAGWNDGRILFDWGWGMEPTHWQPLPAPPAKQEEV